VSDPPEQPPKSGPELARAVLDAAKARRKPSPRRSSGAGKGKPVGRSWSGPGEDPRDPQPFGAVLGKLVASRGWQRPAAEAKLFGQWEEVVGPDVAEHCRPVKLTDGELTIEAVSTSWATQLRLLARSLLKQIAAQIGHNVVTKLHVHGPAAPSWGRGPRRVRGRGPRDTYG
jgi:predicted nucleic acid-binding Zn ribbon protein